MYGVVSVILNVTFMDLSKDEKRAIVRYYTKLSRWIRSH